jgi:hypothetical protein
MRGRRCTTSEPVRRPRTGACERLPSASFHTVARFSVTGGSGDARVERAARSVYRGSVVFTNPGLGVCLLTWSKS